MKPYDIGTYVQWQWGKGTGMGRVTKVHTSKVTLTIKGSDITRNASEDNPAYEIEQATGAQVLKSHSELTEA